MHDSRIPLLPTKIVNGSSTLSGTITAVFIATGMIVPLVRIIGLSAEFGASGQVYAPCAKDAARTRLAASTINDANTASPLKTATIATCGAVGRSRGGSHGWRTVSK
jgi:hypothetical protein